jgi:hypothetical protein
MVMALKEILDGPGETLPDPDTAEAAEVPVINWVGDRVLMNDYEDAEFFTGAFPTLFPYGKGGHLLPANERRVPISLGTWAKWLLSHHSRRFVWKPYVVFIILGPTDFNSGSRVIQHSCTCYTTSFNGGDLHLEILSSSNVGIMNVFKMLYLPSPMTSCLPQLDPYVRLERLQILPFEYYVEQYRRLHRGYRILLHRRKRCAGLFEETLSSSVGVLGGSQSIHLT